jgi:hypothetical protein
MSYQSPSGEPGAVVRRAAIAVIVVTVALLTFAGGLGASRLLGHDAGTGATLADQSGTGTPGVPEPSDTETGPATTGPATTGPTTTAPTGDTTPAAAAGAPRCHTAGLRLSAGPGGAAAGGVYHALGFTNVSGHTCRMYGFPGMAPVDAHGTWITDVRTRREALTPKLITLKPGATAWAMAHWGVADGTYHGAACDPGAAGLVVTPPDETTQLRLLMSVTVCGNGEIWTGPVTDQRPASG